MGLSYAQQGELMLKRMLQAVHFDTAAFEGIESDRQALPASVFIAFLTGVAAGAGLTLMPLEGKERIHTLIVFFLTILAASLTWLVWAFLSFLLGVRRPHPPTLYDSHPLPRSRKIMGIAGYIVFILCFTPEPIVFSWQELFGPFLAN